MTVKKNILLIVIFIFAVLTLFINKLTVFLFKLFCIPIINNKNNIELIEIVINSLLNRNISL